MMSNMKIYEIGQGPTLPLYPHRTEHNKGITTGFHLLGSLDNLCWFTVENGNKY